MNTFKPRRLLALLLILATLLGLLPSAALAADQKEIEIPPEAQRLADYLFEYGQLPETYLTKKEAEALGYQNDLSKVAPGFSIGGNYFGNYEKLLPEAKGRSWYECDVGYVSGGRTYRRVVYSSDGLVFYTPDRFETFIQLYPSEEGDGGDGEDHSGPITEPQDIADYLFANGCLPDNFITKKEAEALGWDSRKNYVSDVAPGCSIGGDRFGNYEGILPTKKGRQYYECDCYYVSGPRSAYRIVFSNDGLVYYTEDHYQTFTEMRPSGK